MGGVEDGDEKQQTHEDRVQPGAGTLGYAGGGFDVRRHAAGAEKSTNGGGQRIDNQNLADVGYAALRIDQARLFTNGGGGAERVEEIDHQHGK